MLPTTVENEIFCFQMVADKGGHYIEHALLTFVHYLYVLNKTMIHRLGVVF